MGLFECYRNLGFIKIFGEDGFSGAGIWVLEVVRGGDRLVLGFSRLFWVPVHCVHPRFMGIEGF